MTRSLVLAVAMMLLAMSCLIDRRSSELECDVDADCADIPGTARECNDGVCLPVFCPSICDTCSADRVCTITCNNPTKCDDGIDCPNNFACVFNCTQDCLDLVCDDGCTVTCAANADCGPIDCGAGETCGCTASGNGTCL